MKEQQWQRQVLFGALISVFANSVKPSLFESWNLESEFGICSRGVTLRRHWGHGEGAELSCRRGSLMDSASVAPEVPVQCIV